MAVNCGDCALTPEIAPALENLSQAKWTYCDVPSIQPRSIPMNWFRDTSEDRKWIREELDAIRWHRRFRTRFFSNGEDNTDSWIADRLGRVRNLLRITRARERT